MRSSARGLGRSMPTIPRSVARRPPGADWKRSSSPACKSAAPRPWPMLTTTSQAMLVRRLDRAPATGASAAATIGKVTVHNGMSRSRKPLSACLQLAGAVYYLWAPGAQISRHHKSPVRRDRWPLA